jgi:Dolichyl-phosphate-mannose-protein mannosyltransferase
VEVENIPPHFCTRIVIGLPAALSPYMRKSIRPMSSPSPSQTPTPVEREELFVFGFIGIPQVIAAILLVFFIAQCAWFISHVPMSQVEANYILQGIGHSQGIYTASDEWRSPLVALTAALPVLPLLHGQNMLAVDQFWLDQHRWFVRTPFLLVGLLLGASVWYVARRMFGNQGGYLALGIYCFSPGIIAHSSLAGPEILGAWGAFGIIFTAIATAHTLYAPREVILWNWKRIVLLGVSIALAVGSQWVLVWLLIPAAAFMLWAVPHRRSAAMAILGAATVIATILIAITYGFHPARFIHSLATAKWMGLSLEAFHTNIASLLLGFYVNASPATGLLFLVALGTYLGWKRSRFFGNTAPLVVAVALLLGGILMALNVGALCFFYALPFLLVFAAGVFADLFESKQQGIAFGVGYGLFLGQIVYSVIGLMRVFSRGM